MLQTGDYQQMARDRGAQLEAGLRPLVGHGVEAVRVRGLWAGIDLDPTIGSGREFSERLLERNILAKDTHGATIRLAPPLVASEDDIELLVSAFRDIVGAAGG